MADENGPGYGFSLPMATVFAVLYGLMCIVTMAQYVYYKCWFWFFAVFATLMEAVGFASKAMSVAGMGTYHLQRDLFITQYVLILIAPAVMAAACYMCMGRIALYVTPPKYRTVRILWVVPRFMTLIFVTCDVLAFLVQVLGGTVAATSTSLSGSIGFRLLQIGLGIQIIAFGFFLIISFRFHIVSRAFRSYGPPTDWVTLLWAINGAASLIFLRSIYRFTEFTFSFDNYLFTHEWPFYVFDATLIFLAMATLNVWHPARFLGNAAWKQMERGWEEIESRRDLDLDGLEETSGRKLRVGSVNGSVRTRELV